MPLPVEITKAIDEHVDQLVVERVADHPIHLNITGAPSNIKIDIESREDHKGHIDLNVTWDSIVEAAKAAADDEEMCGRASIANLDDRRNVA